MAKSEVISLLENYQSIGSEHLELIHHLQQRYPWFSAAYTLESKCLFNENKSGYKKALKKAATFTGNREVLYDFIHNKINQQVKIEAPPAVVKPIEEVVKPTHEISVKDSKAEENPIEVAAQTVSSEPIYDPLVELSKLVDKVEEEPKPQPKIIYDPTVELPKLEKKTKPRSSEKQDFFSWLDRFSEEEKEQPKPRKLQMSKEAAELLDNFIKNRPTISKIRTDVDRLDVYKPGNNDPTLEIVSESLAQLHMKQQRPDLALKVYEKLQLQNPQKFSYFAALIEKIKEEHNLE